MAAADSNLSHLFQAHRQGLAGSVRSVLGGQADVTEILMDAFLKCWRSWQHGTRPDDPVPWIFVVVWNVAVDAQCRKRQRRPIHETLDEDSPVAPAPFFRRRARSSTSEAVAAAQAAVAGLSDAEQQVFLMRVSGSRSSAPTTAAR